ncbi:MAG: hypothetical protein PF637_14630 [Spirochaetes bacterium]|jgi:hypothetical protein|nr:hypothetical protein [Spirochaetota bacterium]
MNQQEIKAKLLELKSDVDDFTVILSGKKSGKVDGLYKPESCEIIIHNKNFESENRLIYTAIHEFAHHIQFTESSGTISSKSHTTLFWNLLHTLLFDAEKKGIYNSLFKTDPRFTELTKKIKAEYLQNNAEIMKKFGNVLLEAMSLCMETHASFEDYLDRELGFKRQEAKALIKAFQHDITSEIGIDNMKLVARIEDDDMRRRALAGFKKGMTEPMVKAEVINPDKYKLQKQDEVELLLKEKLRLEKSIAHLIERLENIDERITSFEGSISDRLITDQGETNV